jgi:hypothetical protein
VLTTLRTLKTRLALDEFNVQFDTLFTNALKASAPGSIRNVQRAN